MFFSYDHLLDYFIVLDEDILNKYLEEIDTDMEDFKECETVEDYNNYIDEFKELLEKNYIILEHKDNIDDCKLEILNILHVIKELCLEF